MDGILPYNTETDHKDRSKVVLKLIYLWAFVEAGFGGLLHLLHIPFTGLLIGGFAVIINVLLAKFGDNKLQVYLKTLGIVLAVKFLFSPYTPFGAYIAVSFQGLLAAALFSILGLNSISIFFFAVLVMIESGLQKPVLALFLLGNDFWNSLIILIADSLDISKEYIKDAGVIFIVVYLLLYIAWGIVLSIWSNSLQKSIQKLQPHSNLLARVNELIHVQQKPGKQTNKKYKQLVSWVSGIIFILVVPILTGSFSVLYLIRIVLLFALILIFIPRLIRKHQTVLFRNNRKITEDIVVKFPIIRNRMMIAWNLAQPFKGLEKVKYFVTYSIWLNIFYEPSTR